MQEKNQNNREFVVTVVSKLKHFYGFRTDKELCEHYNIAITGVGNWKVRGNVPPYVLADYEAIFKPVRQHLPPETTMSLIPVVGIADAGKGIDSSDPGYDDWMTRPNGVKDTQAYAVAIWENGDSMQPVLKPGYKVVASPNLECRNGDLVVAKLKDQKATIKEIHFDNNHVILKSWNPDYEDMRIHKKDLEFCHPIVWFRTNH